MIIRNITSDDYPIILQMNNDNTPAVSELNPSKITALHQQTLFAWVIVTPCETIAGFCFILPPKVNYNSDNYRWVSNRYNQFQYLDRVVISDKFQGQGLGRMLYNHWFSLSNNHPLLLEVNIKPLNQGSLSFHEKMGFHPVGEQDTEGGKKRVQYLALNTPPL